MLAPSDAADAFRHRGGLRETTDTPWKGMREERNARSSGSGKHSERGWRGFAKRCYAGVFTGAFRVIVKKRTATSRATKPIRSKR